MEPRCHREVIELHEFFEHWLTGRMAQDDAAFDRCRSALGPGFRLVSPDGRVEARAPLLERLRAAHGARPGLRMWIEDLDCQVLGDAGGSDATALVTYTEHQDTGAEVTTRVSTALMAAAANAPNGVVWRHVHETWTARARTNALLARFEASALTLAELDHAMHVEIAWNYVRTYPLLEALARFIAALQRFAAAHSKSRLYHETITWAYMLIVNDRVARAPALTWDEFSAANPDIMARGKQVLERYYQPDTLASELARARVLFPDRGR